MAIRQETRLSFNKMLKMAFEASTMTQIADGIDLVSFKRAIYRQMFGVGSLVFVDGKDLIETMDDASTGGLKAININKKQIELIYEKVDVFAGDSNLKLTVTQIMDEILKTIVNLQVATKQFIKKQLDEDKKTQLAIEQALYPVKPAGPKQVIKTIKNILNEIKHTKKVGDFKTIKNINTTLQKKIGIGSLTQMSIPFGASLVFGKIPILLGPVPLKHVNHVEVARSGKILKFRATGSVYLAGQHGGDQMDAIKIEGILYKAEFGFMFLLWALFLYGQSKFKELDQLVSGQTNITEISKLRKINDLIVTDTSLQRPSYEFHRTFPFANKHFIIPYCFIETIVLEDKLPLKDVMRYTILLRTYKKPTEAVRFVKSKDENISVFGLTKKTFTAEICQYSLSFAWRMFNAYGWIADEMEWRIGSASKPGVLDTYYDIDPMAISTVAYLSLMGAVV